jgi:hypothetical protein
MILRIIAIKALIYQGPGKKSLVDRPVLEIIHSIDEGIKIIKTTIDCTYVKYVRKPL